MKLSVEPQGIIPEQQTCVVPGRLCRPDAADAPVTATLTVGALDHAITLHHWQGMDVHTLMDIVDHKAFGALGGDRQVDSLMVDSDGYTGDGLKKLHARTPHIEWPALGAILYSLEVADVVVPVVRDDQDHTVSAYQTMLISGQRGLESPDGRLHMSDVKSIIQQAITDALDECYPDRMHLDNPLIMRLSIGPAVNIK